jgi:DNA-binding transcriptional ArsR family regulator
MGITKTEPFDSELVDRANLLKALGHPARLAIVQHLLEQETCICGDLVIKLPLAQATISQHLRELKQVGIIQGTVSGTSVCYCLNREIFKDLRDFFKDSAKQIKKNKC